VAGRPDRLRRADGFTVLELLVSVAIMLVVAGAAFELASPANGVFSAQPEVSDMQQRLRVSADALHRDLVMAGAGTYSGAIAGTLLNFFAPVLPYRVGAFNSDPGLSFFTNRITIMYVPNTASQTTLREAMPQPSSEIKVNAEPGCPSGDPLCGFQEGMRCVIFDDTGAFDTFTITQVQSDALHLQHRPPNPDFSKKYTPAENARISQVETHVYYVDQATNQLRHYDGWLEDIALADNVAALEIRYFGDPPPPAAPRPKPGLSNCVFDAAGNPTMPQLAATSGSLVPLPQAILTDGPLCGVAPNQFHADLYRVRQISVRLRTQVAQRWMRGTDPQLFTNPGTATAGTTFVPDFEMSFEVSPRNLNLTR
jgi:prepilin-type N-terminal cleavage/methylation domain-containing protein